METNFSIPFYKYYFGLSKNTVPQTENLPYYLKQKPILPIFPFEIV